MKFNPHQQDYCLLQPSAEEGGVRPLSPEDLDYFRGMQVQQGVPVRFLHAGCAVDVVTGQKQPQGIPAHHQIHYWNFDRETAQQIAKVTGTTPVILAN